MRYPGFVNGSYQSQSPLADDELTMNWYPEAIEMPGSVTRAAFYPTPGQQPFVTVTDVGTRALLYIAGRMFAVIGAGFYEVFVTQTATPRGTVRQDTYPATISYNGPTGGQLFITSGGNGYCYDLTTNALTIVLTGEATQGGMVDGYFLAFNLATGRVRLSNLNDGTTWDPNQFFARSIAPDPWQAMLIVDREICLIGEKTGEFWYDAGNFPQPFAPNNSAIFNYGTIAPFGAAIVAGRPTWLSQSDDGAGIVVAAEGYSPQRISTHAVETEIANFARTARITDAEVLSYQDQGHQFGSFTFPSANATRVFDATTSLWHHRGTWNNGANRQDAWKARVHCYAFGKHLVGDWSSGTINELDVTFGSEADGSVIRRTRIPPGLTVASRRRPVRVRRFEVLMEPGLGLVSGQGSDPQLMLRTSRNGGKTWSAERSRSAGALGDYGATAVWTRCGSSPTVWVPEVSVSDPIAWRLIGADVEGDGWLTAAA